MVLRSPDPSDAAAPACDTGLAKLSIRIPGLAELIGSWMLSVRPPVPRVSLGF